MRAIPWMIGLALSGRATAGEVVDPGPPGALALEVTRELAEQIGPRPAGGPGAAVARRALMERLARAGLEPREQSFSGVVHPGVRVFGHWFFPRSDARFLGEAGRNIYLVVPGRSPEAVVLSAHIDTEEPDVPGARDDAAAVGLVVELAARAAARARREGPPARTRVFALFEAEERGHLGARAFARDGIAGPKVAFALSLDVVGGGGLALNGLGPTVDRAAVAAALAAARRTGVPLSAPLPHLFFSRVAPEGERSDHRAFAEGGVGAFHILSRGDEGFDTTYHTPRDAFDRVDPRAMADTSRLVDELLATIDPALDRPAGDVHFLPIGFPDPIGLGEGRTLLLPGGLARALAIACGAGALLALALLFRRWRQSGTAAREALRSAALVPLAGAALGLAFAAPFVAGCLSTGLRAPWHAPFGRYVAAGAVAAAALAFAIAARPSLARAALRPGACAAFGAITALAVAAAFAWVGVLEVALLPASLALALAAAALADRPALRALLSLGALPGLGLLVRPALYRDGALTATLPEAGAGYLLVLALTGAAVAPALLFVAGAWLALARRYLARLLDGKRRFAAPLLLAAAALALTARAVRSPAYDDELPAVLRLAEQIDDGAASYTLDGTALGPEVILLVDGAPVPLATDGGRATATLPGAPPGIAIDARAVPDPQGRRRARVTIAHAPGAPAIDRVEIFYRPAAPTRVGLAAGGEVALAAGEELYVQIFGAGGAEAIADERSFDGPALPLELLVQVRLAASPHTLEVRTPPHFTVARTSLVKRLVSIPN